MRLTDLFVQALNEARAYREVSQVALDALAEGTAIRHHQARTIAGLRDENRSLRTGAEGALL